MRSRPSTARAATAAAVAVVVPLLLGGCTSSVAVEVARDAADPLCARVYASLPDGVAGLDRRSTTSQGTAAWVGGGADGEAERVVLRCGVTQPGPSAQCTQVDDAESGTTVDWIYSEPVDGHVTWTTYGRQPAVELTMPADESVTLSAPQDVSPAVAQVPAQRRCT